MSTTSPTNTENRYDVIVIGAGPVGETLAEKVVANGLSAALVEHDLVGGDCAYYACKPSKALLRPIQIAKASQHLTGVRPTTIVADDLLARRNEKVSHYHDAAQKWTMEDLGITVVRGHGRLNGERSVEVHGSDGATHTLHANRVVALTTGTVANIPPVFEGIPVWDSKDATAVRDVPARLVIVGGGPVACEAASWMSALGSKVTMLVREGLLLGKFEPFVSDMIADQLTEAGIDIQFFTEAAEVRRPDGMDHGVGEIKGGPVALRTKAGDTIEADEVLLATGRRPDLGAVDLESVGLSADDVLEDNLPEWLYAIGDAGGKYQLTHMGKYQARTLAKQLTSVAEHPEDDALDTEPPITQVVFTDPQVASVGLTEDAARESGYDIVTAEVDFGDVKGAALQRDNVVGRAKIVVDKATNSLIGATLVGPEAGEMLHAASIAVAAQIPVPMLQEAVPVFPTASEIWVSLLEQVGA